MEWYGPRIRIGLRKYVHIDFHMFLGHDTSNMQLAQNMYYPDFSPTCYHGRMSPWAHGPTGPRAHGPMGLWAHGPMGA